MFYLTMHSTHFIYGYMASDIWYRTTQIAREKTRCHHMGYSFRLAARVLLYASSHRQDNEYHGFCYTSCGALAGTRNLTSRKHSVCLCIVLNQKTLSNGLTITYQTFHILYLDISKTAYPKSVHLFLMVLKDGILIIFTINYT